MILFFILFLEEFMKLQKVGILAVTLTILTLNSQAMEKPCTSIDGLRNDSTSLFSWLPGDLQKELDKFITNNKNHLALKWTLHTHAQSVGFNAKPWRVNDPIKGNDTLVVGNNNFISISNANIKIWDSKTKQFEKILLGHRDNISCLAILNDTIVSGSDDKTIKIWNLEKGECQKTLLGHTHRITCLAVANKNIISGSDDETIKIWNPETGYCEKILEGHEDGISCLAVNKENNCLFSGSKDETIKIWNLKDGNCCYSLQLPDDRVAEYIDAADGYVKCSNVFSVITILNLEDSTIKELLEDNSIDRAYLLIAVYECFQNKKTLDLRTNTWLYNGFTRLPLALQNVIQKKIMVRFPTQNAVNVIQTSGYISSWVKYIFG